MTRDDYIGSLIGFGHVATASGLPEHEQALALLVAALGIADKNVRLGVSREQFCSMAGDVYDNLRRALAGGTKGGN